MSGTGSGPGQDIAGGTSGYSGTSGFSGVSGAGGGAGITNSAPQDTLPVTVDGSGNLGPSSIIFDGTNIKTTGREVFVGDFFSTALNYIGFYHSPGTGQTFDVYNYSDDGNHFFQIFGFADNGPSSLVELSADATLISLNGVAKAISLTADPTTGQINLNAANMGFFDKSNVARPEVPAVPLPQDIVDALVALGLITQAP